MKYYDSKNRNFFCFIGFVIIFLLLWFIGCKQHPKQGDPNIVILEKLSQNSSVSQDVRDLARQAIANYRNGTIDPKPELLYLSPIIETSESEKNEFIITVIDEDNDLLGLGIKEESRDPNSKIDILEEEYPVFVHYPGLTVVNGYSIPFFIRSHEQQKNEKSWTDYLAIDFDTRMKQIKLPYSSGDQFADTEEYFIRVYELWEDTLPLVWISIPDPDRLTVWIYVYDKAGHKSNSMKLVKYIDPNGSQ